MTIPGIFFLIAFISLVLYAWDASQGKIEMYHKWADLKPYQWAYFVGGIGGTICFFLSLIVVFVVS